MSKSWTMTH